MVPSPCTTTRRTCPRWRGRAGAPGERSAGRGPVAFADDAEVCCQYNRTTHLLDACSTPLQIKAASSLGGGPSRKDQELSRMATVVLIGSAAVCSAAVAGWMLLMRAPAESHSAASVVRAAAAAPGSDVILPRYRGQLHYADILFDCNKNNSNSIGLT